MILDVELSSDHWGDPNLRHNVRISVQGRGKGGGVPSWAPLVPLFVACHFLLHGPASTTAMSPHHITIAAKGCIIPADHPSATTPSPQLLQHRINSHMSARRPMHKSADVSAYKSAYMPMPMFVHMHVRRACARA